MNNFYVYAHTRLDKNTIFYIGKGKNGRAFDLQRRNLYWKNIVNKHGYKIHFLKKNLNEDQAFYFEAKYHGFFKKRNLCEANLITELPNGGRSLSEETKRKISQSLKGQKLSKETREKIRKALLGKKQPNISKAMKGRVFTDKWKKKISESKKKYKFTDEHRKNIGKTSKGRNLGVSLPEERKEKIRKGNQQFVYYTPNGIFESAQHAAIYYKTYRRAIYKKCNNLNIENWYRVKAKIKEKNL